MDTRAVLSYDDITDLDVLASSDTMDNKSPPKQPRWTKPNARGPPAPKRPRLHAEAHWDSSIEPTSIVYYDPIDTIPPSTSDRQLHPTVAQPKPGPSHSPSHKRMMTANGNGYLKKEQQREQYPSSVSLGDKDAWDDSSLIDAWEAANEEYERLNGPGKSWKDEPVVKSSLWYGAHNTLKSKAPPIRGEENFEEGYDDEGELENEDTQEVPADNTITSTFPDITQFAQNASDYTTQEVFQQALNSAWWLGYWTAMHQTKINPPLVVEETEPTIPPR